MNVWLKFYGWTIEPLAFCDDAELDTLTKFLDAVEGQWPGSTRIQRLIARHDGWLKKKRTDGRSWYDIITENLDENFQDHDDAEYTYDAE
jgi:hypothetical protein